MFCFRESIFFFSTTSDWEKVLLVKKKKKKTSDCKIMTINPKKALAQKKKARFLNIKSALIVDTIQCAKNL